MKTFDPGELQNLYRPSPTSHKGQNGKLLLIGGSTLFHAASLWALSIASKIVDMVFYASVPENNEIVQNAKAAFREGIVIRREDVESYIDEADVVLIGPGMLRSESGISNVKFQMSNLQEITKIVDEGEQTYYLTKYLLEKYPHKKWVIDAGALQMLEPEWLLPLQGNVILTPHPGEFERLQSKTQNAKAKTTIQNAKVEEHVYAFAQTFDCIIVLKGVEDIVCSPDNAVTIAGGNAGMTKGGTGDILAGLIAALACKNDLFLASCAGSYFNKKAADALFQRVSYYYSSSELVAEIPQQMKQLLG